MPRRFITFSLAALIWLGVATLTGAGLRSERPNQLPKNPDRKNVMITLNVKGERSDYIPGSEVRLDVQIKNGGASAITIADPQDPSNGEMEYLVGGPFWLTERKFTQRMATAASGAASGGGESFPPVTIDPGSAFETSVSLSALADLSAIGEYRVRLCLGRPEASPVEAEECVVRVRGVRASAVDVALGVSDNWDEGEGAFIEHGELHTFEFRESSPEISEADTGEVIHRASVGKATDVAIPARNTPFFDELVRWVVWLDGPSVKAMTSVETVPASVKLPTEATCLIKSPLKTKGGPVEAFVLARDRKSVVLVKFDRVATPGPDPVRQAAGSLGWTVPLPAEAHTIAAALGPVALGSERHIVFAANTANGIEIFHARVGEKGLESPFASGRIQCKPARTGAGGGAGLAEEGSGRVTFLPDSIEAAHIPRLLERGTPALHVDERGDVWASFLALADKRAFWIEARFARGDAVPPTLRVTELAPLDKGIPTDGAILYVGDRTSSIRRREVALMIDGERLTRWMGNALVPVHIHGTVAKPLLIVPGSAISYLLHMDEAPGPHLEPLQ